jgi:ABC-type amino acid transport substrate-binding protein
MFRVTFSRSLAIKTQRVPIVESHKNALGDKSMIRLWVLLVSLTLLAAPVSAADFTGTLKKIQDSQTIRIGYRDSTPPMSFVGPDGTPVGYSIDICTRIATAAKQTLQLDQIKTEFVAVTAADRFDKLKSGEIDILCGATTKTLSRGEQVDFSQLIFVTGANLLSKKDAPLGTVSDLSGKKVGVTEKTTTIETLGRALKATLTEAEIVSVTSGNAGFDALRAGNIDALAADQVTLIGLLINAEDRNDFVVSTELFSYEPLALAVRRDDADFRLLTDRVIAFLYKTRQIDGIYGKWFSAFGSKRPALVEALYRLGSTPE